MVEKKRRRKEGDKRESPFKESTTTTMTASCATARSDAKSLLFPSTAIQTSPREEEEEHNSFRARREGGRPVCSVEWSVGPFDRSLNSLTQYLQSRPLSQKRKREIAKYGPFVREVQSDSEKKEQESHLLCRAG